MKKLRMKDVITREGYECLTAEERHAQLKVEQAKEISGLRRYPSTCSAVLLAVISNRPHPCRVVEQVQRRAHRRGDAAAQGRL